MKKGQGSLEYLIIVGFVTFLVISVLLVAYIYTGTLKNKIKITQVDSFGNKVISTAETMFYSGEPSKTTLDIYLPGVNSINITGNLIIIKYQTGATQTIRAYEGKVNMTGAINVSLGIKKLIFEAKSDHVDIHQ